MFIIVLRAICLVDLPLSPNNPYNFKNGNRHAFAFTTHYPNTQVWDTWFSDPSYVTFDMFFFLFTRFVQMKLKKKKVYLKLACMQLILYVDHFSSSYLSLVCNQDPKHQYYQIKSSIFRTSHSPTTNICSLVELG